MAKHFFYSREKKVNKKDEKGNVIPVKDDKGNIVPNQFEHDVVYMEDSFNLSKVIRTHMMNDDHVIVLLDDGHEESQVIDQKLKNPKKPPTPDNVENIKARVWVQSEISVRGEEKIQELFDALRDEQ